MHRRAFINGFQELTAHRAVEEGKENVLVMLYHEYRLVNPLSEKDRTSDTSQVVLYVKKNDKNCRYFARLGALRSQGQCGASER